MQAACSPKGARSFYNTLIVKSLQNAIQSKASEIVYDDIAVGSDGFAAVCRGEANDAGAGGAGCGQAME